MISWGESSGQVFAERHLVPDVAFRSVNIEYEPSFNYGDGNDFLDLTQIGISQSSINVLINNITEWMNQTQEWGIKTESDGGVIAFGDKPDSTEIAVRFDSGSTSATGVLRDYPSGGKLGIWNPTGISNIARLIFTRHGAAGQLTCVTSSMTISNIYNALENFRLGIRSISDYKLYPIMTYFSDVDEYVPCDNIRTVKSITSVEKIYGGNYNPLTGLFICQWCGIELGSVEFTDNEDGTFSYQSSVLPDGSDFQAFCRRYEVGDFDNLASGEIGISDTGEIKVKPTTEMTLVEFTAANANKCFIYKRKETLEFSVDPVELVQKMDYNTLYGCCDQPFKRNISVEYAYDDSLLESEQVIDTNSMSGSLGTALHITPFEKFDIDVTDVEI